VKTHVNRAVAAAFAAPVFRVDLPRAVAAAPAPPRAVLGLYASGITCIGKLGLAAAVLCAVTLVPALLGLASRGIDRHPARRPVAESAGGRDFWHRRIGLWPGGRP
jgi:uncharacterized membrane protein YdfJ with MMPL/SSD domain